jgi:hypothetical protein
MRCITRWISLWITLWILAHPTDVVGCVTTNLVGRSAAVFCAPPDEAAPVSRETFSDIGISNFLTAEHLVVGGNWVIPPIFVGPVSFRAGSLSGVPKAGVHQWKSCKLQQLWICPGSQSAPK